jgi:putative transposase
MDAIVSLLQCLDQILERKTKTQLSRIIMAMLAMSGRVTMLGLSRWAGKGARYRTIQRFFNQPLPWPLLNWLVIRSQLPVGEDTVLLAGDETVVPKAGKKTYGLDRFFAPLLKRTVPALSFFAISLVSVQEHRSYPLVLEQVVGAETNKLSPSSVPAKKAQGPGRPKGRKNRNRRDVELSPYLLKVQRMLREALALLEGTTPVGYCLLDGFFGNNHALQMVRQCNLHLISKLRSDAALYLPYDGPQPARGQRRKYGARVDVQQLPEQALQLRTEENGVRCDIFQLTVRHRLFPDPLNVVIIQRFAEGKAAHIILFSSDLSLSYEQILLYYQLRFQLEFNFRDAKQYWGLDDFMNVKPQPVSTAANLAMFMPNVVHGLLRPFQVQHPAFSVNDLKAHYRGLKYVEEVLKLLPPPPEPIFINLFFASVLALGSVNVRPSPS